MRIVCPWVSLTKDPPASKRLTGRVPTDAELDDLVAYVSAL
jgi:hypothetical protein